jgi:hypothetical protein
VLGTVVTTEKLVSPAAATRQRSWTASDRHSTAAGPNRGARRTSSDLPFLYTHRSRASCSIFTARAVKPAALAGTAFF